MATTPLTVDEISRTILERMTSNHGGSLVEAIEDGAFVVDDQTVAYWVSQAVELARQGLDIPDLNDEPVGYACAECGTQIGLPHELGNKSRRRTLVDVCW